ncbi:MAG TPA: hypothetical protein VKQ30_22155 [Ktedonobacterales bacterium]|nr:hypothetical protein [Ktedonobacterales bacterium]
MPRHEDMGRPRRSPLRALVLAIACGWLLLVLSALVSPAVFAFGSVNLPKIPAGASSVCPPCLLTVSITLSPTATPTVTPTATPTGAATPTPGASPTATATATTAPNGGGGGGGGGGGQGGGGGPAGPNVTRVVYSQATVGTNDNSPLQGITPSAFGSNGLLLASTLSCVVAILGVIIAAIALLVLVRGGYGPFLKALLGGKRAGRKRAALAHSGVSPDWNTGNDRRQASGMQYRSPEGGYGSRGQGYAANSQSGYDSYSPPPGRSASRQVRQPAPNPRSRQDRR